jgi:hypothetical protein
MAAPELNANSMQHGKRSRRLIPLGALPPGCQHIRKVCSILRAQLEAVVVDQLNEVSIVSAATINTAIRFERHAQMAGKWLREHPELPVDTRLAISRDIAKASAERDRCIRLLGLTEAAKRNPWDEYYRQAREKMLAKPAASAPWGQQTVSTPATLPDAAGATQTENPTEHPSRPQAAPQGLVEGGRDAT